MLKSEDKVEYIVGIDEAGRGPLAGPVVAAAVILHPMKPIEGLADSKKISEKKRIQLFNIIKSKAFAWSVGHASVAEIDKLNIHYATLLAMQRAFSKLGLNVNRILVDGLYCPDLLENCTAVVKGDQKIPEISAASILAKVTRDFEMENYHLELPQYGFNQHKGYPTAQHVAALQKYGPSNLHRKSYKPVKDAMCLNRSKYF